MGLSVCVIIGITWIWLSCDTSKNIQKNETSSQIIKNGGSTMTDKIVKTDAEWKEILTSEQYRILRKKGTEPAFSGKYYHFTEEGIYQCAACGNELFSSKTKYDSGSGWPSFWKPISENSVETEKDTSLMMHRTEVHCARCGGHLGHLFEDGPDPTGLRYCINSAALQFVPEEQR
jgi:peptide-methionine (R)-S-oxide reductase